VGEGSSLEALDPIFNKGMQRLVLCPCRLQAILSFLDVAQAKKGTSINGRTNIVALDLLPRGLRASLTFLVKVVGQSTETNGVNTE